MAQGSYLALIKFQGDTSSMQKMEKDLNGRFTKIAKRFGQGLQKAGKMLKFGAFAATAAGIISQILNPLQEINTALDAILAKSGNIKDQADAMNTSVGLYAALQSAAAAKGVDEAQFNLMGNRVMELIGQAKTGDNDLLKNYANESDMAVALYKVVSALKQMGPGAERTRMASEIFGQRVTGRMAALLNDGFDEPLKRVLDGLNIADLQKAILGLDSKGDLQDVLRQRLNLRDLINKDKVITSAAIYNQNDMEKQRLNRENLLLKQYKDLAQMSNSMEELKNAILQYVLPIMPLLAKGVKYFVETLGPILQNACWVVSETADIVKLIAGKIGISFAKTPSVQRDIINTGNPQKAPKGLAAWKENTQKERYGGGGK